jgi:hypothetical protein
MVTGNNRLCRYRTRNVCQAAAAKVSTVRGGDDPAEALNKPTYCNTPAQVRRQLRPRLLQGAHQIDNASGYLARLGRTGRCANCCEAGQPRAAHISHMRPLALVHARAPSLPGLSRALRTGLRLRRHPGYRPKRGWAHDQKTCLTQNKSFRSSRLSVA